MHNLPICVLSLPESVGRRQRISGLLNGLGLAFEFRDAWSPEDIPEDMQELLGVRNRAGDADSAALLPTERACYASHMGIISDVAQGRLPSPLLVLEDDAIFDERSAEFARRLHQLMQNDPEIEYVNFKNTKGPYVLKRMPVLDEACIFVPWYPSLGMVAYMIRREGARKILRLRRKGNRPLDQEMRHVIWEQDLKYWECFPSMVAHDDARDSTIDPEHRRIARKIGFGEKLEKLGHMLKKHGAGNFMKFYPLFLRDKLARKRAGAAKEEAGEQRLLKKHP